MTEEVAYLSVGYLIAGAHFAWATPHLPPSKFHDLLPPVWRLGVFCVVVVASFWPIYLCMLLGARAFHAYTKEPS